MAATFVVCEFSTKRNFNELAGAVAYFRERNIVVRSIEELLSGQPVRRSARRRGIWSDWFGKARSWISSRPKWIKLDHEEKR